MPPGPAPTSGTQLHLQHIVGRLPRLLKPHIETPVLSHFWTALARRVHQIVPGLLAHVSEHVEQVLSQVVGQAKQVARAAFRDWASRAVQHGAGKAHFWTKKRGARPRLVDVLLTDGQHILTDPADP